MNTDLPARASHLPTPATGGDAGSRVLLARAAWLDTKAGRSGSTKTAHYNAETERWEGAYPDTLDSFRDELVALGLDLDSHTDAVALAAQRWAAQRSVKANRLGEISPATYNQRLAVISSFYVFARRRGLLHVDNPIDQLERRMVQRYHKAVALSPETVAAALAAIDRSDLVGQRDYALLSVAVATGQRASELASLRCRHVQHGRPLVVTFERTKGGKSVRKPLPPNTGQALARYLTTLHGEAWPKAGDAPVWVSLSNKAQGQPLTIDGIADVCERHLGTTKIHTLRHTTAKALERAGASISDIQKILGHANAATTSEYLQSLDVVDSRHVATIEQLFGIGEAT